MKEVYLISCFKRKMRNLYYGEGDRFSLPFKGVYNGQVVDIVDIETPFDFKVPEAGSVCLCNVLIINVEKGRIVGKLESIDFL